MKRSLIATGVYIALAVAMTFPVLSHFGATLPHDLGDPALNTWIIWWNHQQLPLTQAWWNAPMFFPAANVMALSETLLGLLPITAPVQWLSGNPVAGYNAAYVLSFLLSGIAGYLLGVELTGRRDCAMLAGIAYAYAPYRIGQLSHLQVLSYYWAPIAVLALHRFVRTWQVQWLMLFGGSWLMQSLVNGYALFHLSVLVALWILWFSRSWRTGLAIVIAWAVSAIPLAPLLIKYRSVQSELHLVRDINEIKRLSVDVADLASAPADMMLWRELLRPARPEAASFPGATILLVGAVWLVMWWRYDRQRNPERTADEKALIALSAVAALVAISTFVVGPWAIGPLTVTYFYKPFSIAVLLRLLAFVRTPWFRRAWRSRSVAAFYLTTAGASYLLAMGPEPRFLGRPILYEAPYAWLMRVPGFDALRVPARFVMIAVLCQSVLLALAAARWVAPLARRRLVVALIATGILLDGWSRLHVKPVPRPGPDWHDVAAVVELPMTSTVTDQRALYRATQYRLPILNGYSGYYPPHYLPLMFALRDGQYAALHDIGNGARLGIAVDRESEQAADIEQALRDTDGAVAAPANDGWASFIFQTRATVRVEPLGRELSPRYVRANRYPEDVDRLHDGSVETAWASGTSQIGGEEVVIDLGTSQEVGSLVFGMGAFSFGFPNRLEVASSEDAQTWQPRWSGPTAVPTVQAAIADPRTVPLTIHLGRVQTRYLRLRQLGTEPGIPWWIAELTVFAPAGNGVAR